MSWDDDDDQFTMFGQAHPVGAAFRLYDSQNPAVYKLFVRFTFEAINAGRKRFSARMVLERIRWYTDVEARDEATGFRFNNNYTPYYVRKFEREYPEHCNFFEKRASRADEEYGW